MKSTITPQQVFNNVAKPEIQRSTFDRSHGYKTTMDAGLLIPIFVDEALPGDTFNVSTSVFARLSTPLKPIMDNLYMDIHYFSVPLRLVWDNWKKFNGEQNNPLDSTNFLIPQITSTAVSGYGEQSIFDYMGLPTKVPGVEHSALFLRSYNLIYNEWYRDENLQTSVTVETDDGPDLPSQYTVLPRGKRKDYFTSALPFAQKGTAVSVPLGTTAPVTGSGAPTFDANGIGPATQLRFSSTTAGNAIVNVGGVNNTNALTWANTGLSVNLASATAATINQLREAFQVQKMYEKDARGGTRYTEVIRAHFGVISPDARLQRPEYLGGSTTNIMINPISQTAPTVSGQTPQGNLAAVGTAAHSGHSFVKSFTEHEIIIGLASVRADLNYQQGLNRMWSRQTRFDFYWPSLSHLDIQILVRRQPFLVYIFLY